VKKFYLSSLVLLLMTAMVPAEASSADSTALDSAKRFLGLQRYNDASVLLDRILKSDPSNFEALYMQLATRQTRILDYESYMVWGDSFLLYSDSVLSALQNLLPLQRGKDSVRCLFYVGNVYGGKGVIHAKCERWIQAVRDALTSINIFRQVRILDPSFRAAYLGTGAFKYYLSNDLKWVPGVGNRAQEGLEEIRLATTAEYPFNIAAKDLLCWILIDRGEYRRADSVAATVLSQMPDNTIFLRIRAQSALKMQRWQATLEAAKHLVDVSRSRTPVNWSDLLMGYRIMMEYYDYHKKGEEVRALTKQIEAHTVPSEYLRISHVRAHHRRIAEVERKYAQGL